MPMFVYALRGDDIVPWKTALASREIVLAGA
jgi:hypothetical protein